MPIEFQPPQANLNYQIPPPQSTDPLQTLAQMGQLRTQGLQQQTAGMQLEQQRMQLDSNKAMLKAMVDAGTQGSPDEIYQRIVQNATQSGKVLPEHLITLGEHQMKLRQDAAALQKTALENQGAQIDRLRGIYEPLTKPGATDEDFARANATADQLGIPKTIPRLTQWTDPEHVAAHSNMLALHSQILNEEKERAATEASRATAVKEAALTTEAQQKIDVGEKAAIAQELQAAPKDPTTGTPTPAAMAEIQARHPKAVMPPPTKEAIADYVRSLVPAEKQPEYDINAAMARIGQMGKDKWDQFLVQYARGIGKTPANIAPNEFNAALKAYAEFTQDPAMRTILMGMRGAQEKVASAQVASILTPEQIQSNARDLLNGDLAPDQIKELRPGGRINQGPQIIEAARAIAKAEGKNFSLFDLQQQAAEREKTLSEFMNTTAGHAGGQKLALNTLIHHADLYLDAAKALKNGTFTPGNEIYNKVASTFGAAPPTNAALLAQFFASETGKVATGGVPAEGEIKSILKSMSTSGSPEAMEGAGKTLIGIAAGRMIPLKELRDKANLQKHVDILGPDAREILARRGFDPETMKPATAKKAAPGGHTIRVNGKLYQYKGTGDTGDLNNYTEVKR
jgi:hypothetical protein